MFKTLTGVLDPKKNPSEDEINKIPPFIFCRWLSGNPSAIMAANQLNFYDKIPMVNQYKVIKGVFAGKIKYIPYPKNTKEDESIKVGYLCDFFKISTEKANEYLEFIAPQELEHIINMYERDNNVK
jgi:hypothetical protein